ncbi:helix-turn-helix domain-containing protein [Paenibacillaceae bacterium]|nr:helix-turn-helix domain-containing protein [Paenibacillaceae bacterium]
MNWNHFKSKLLLKYALSYILIFLIPLTCVTFFIYQNAVVNLRSEIEQSNVNQLNQVKTTIDGHITGLHEIASKISYDERLTPYMIHHPYYSREAITALAGYKANSNILEELFLYYHDDSQIYSYAGSTNVNVIFDKVYQYENWKSEDIVTALNETKLTLVRPAENVTVHSRKESMLTVLVPIKITGPYPYGTVMYVMKEAKLTGVMNAILNDFSGNSFIFSGTSEVLTASSNGKDLPADVLVTLSDLEPGIHSMLLDGEMHSVVSVKSKVNGWNYVTAMPSYQFFERVAHIQTLIWLVFCITVFTGVIVAMFLAKRQYHPIQNLMAFAKMQRGNKDTIKARNEWDWIRQTLHDYNARIDMQEPFVRNQCLLLLLKHGKPDDPEIERMITQSGLEIPDQQGLYFSAMLTWDEQAQAERTWEDQQNLQEMLSQIAFPDLNAHVYGVELSASNQFALMISLLATDQLAESERIKQVIEAINVMIIEHSHRLPTIGVGTIYHDLASLNQSFIEAATALEHSMLTASGRVTYFEQLTALPSSASENFWIPKKSMLKLEQSLKQGNEAVALQMISSIMQEVKQASLPVALLRCLCFDLLNSLLRTAAELGMSEVLGNISSLTSFETLEELEMKLSSLSSHICQQVEHNTETDQPKLIDDVVAYVDQQFADYTLSLEHVALKYSISTSYLSRSFKEKTGYNFSQYIWQCRLKEVIRLLIHTSAPLKDIIESVGYLDAPNFIRKFKKETGCTPGQYRKLHSSSPITVD